MRFEDKDFEICAMSDGREGIKISKETLERWRDHYRDIEINQFKDMSTPNTIYKRGLYGGKADVLIEILKHFDELCV